MRRRQLDYLIWDPDQRVYTTYDRHSELRTIPQGLRNPIARWRIAVATVMQPLLIVAIVLFLRGVVGTPWNRPWAFEALFLVVPLSAGLVVLMPSAIMMGLLGSAAGLWRREDGR